MSKTFDVGILISPEYIDIGLVQDRSISLIEKKINSEEKSLSEIEGIIEDLANEAGLKITDINEIKYFVDYKKNTDKKAESQLRKIAEKNKIKLCKIENPAWILDSNWIYNLKEIEEEEITDHSPQYPYITVLSNKNSVDFILNNEKNDSRIIGSFIDQTPPELIADVSEILDISDTREINNLATLGDSNALDFDYEIKPDFDMEISAIKAKIKAYYEKEKANYISLKDEKLKAELLNNLKADMLAALYEKLFDYINAKLFGIADAFGVKNISLIGNFWIDQRLQDKMLRISLSDDFKLKFPAKGNTSPFGSLLAAYDSQNT